MKFPITLVMTWHWKALKVQDRHKKKVSKNPVVSNMVKAKVILVILTKEDGLMKNTLNSWKH